MVRKGEGGFSRFHGRPPSSQPRDLWDLLESSPPGTALVTAYACVRAWLLWNLELPSKAFFSPSRVAIYSTPFLYAFTPLKDGPPAETSVSKPAFVSYYSFLVCSITFNIFFRPILSRSPSPIVYISICDVQKDVL